MPLARQVGVALLAATAALGAVWSRRARRSAAPTPPMPPVRTLAEPTGAVAVAPGGCVTVAAAPTRVAVAAVYSAASRPGTR